MKIGIRAIVSSEDISRDLAREREREGGERERTGQKERIRGGVETRPVDPVVLY